MGYKGLSKSSMKRGNNLLFGRNGLVTGLFEVGSSITKDILDSAEQTDTSNINSQITKNNTTGIATIVIILVAIAVIAIIIYVPNIILGLLILGAMFKK